jgi:hypothetical protein
MPDGPTLEHTRLAAIEVGGRPLDIKSAELARIQYWNGDEPAQLEWEIRGRTDEDTLTDTVHPIVITIGESRFKGRGVFRTSRSYGMTVFHIVGLDPLVEVR